MRFKSFVIPIATAILAATAGPLGAAPQALGLVAMDAATPLRCEGGVCRAEFTTFCLQKARSFPARGTAYEVAASGDLTLRWRDSEGRLHRVAAAPHIRIHTPRAGHAAVTITLAASRLAALGGTRAAIEVGERVTLTPVAIAGDPDPQGEAERRRVAGPLRALGADMVDAGGEGIELARSLVRLVNALPEGIDRGAHARDRLWVRALRDGLAATTPARRRLAAREYARCWDDRVVQLGGYSVRECLSRRHDEVMWGEVTRYWKAAEPGS